MMRKVHEYVLPPSERLRVLTLGVTDGVSIGQAVKAAYNSCMRGGSD